MLRNKRPKAGRNTPARVSRSVVAFARWILAGLVVAVLVGGSSSIAAADPVAVPNALPTLTITATPGSTVAIPLETVTTDADSGLVLDASTFSVTTPPQVGQVGSSGSAVSYTAPADVPGQYVTAATNPPAQDPPASPAPQIFVPVFFDYTVCTDLTLTTCESGVVSIVIEPSTLASRPDPEVAVETGQTIAIAADVYLSQPAGVDWPTLEVHADSGTASVSGEAISYTAAAQPGSDHLDVVACPVGDPNSCISASITVSVVAAFAPSAAIDTASFNADGMLVVAVPGLASDNPPDETTMTVNSQPAAGEVTISGDTFVVSGLTPDFSGQLSFGYYACSRINPTDCATGSITVTVPPPAESVPVAPDPGDDSGSGFRPAASVKSPPTATADQPATPQLSPTGSPAGSMDITWWVFGGALLLALGGGTGLLATKKR